jgi:hypothetical protein
MSIILTAGKCDYLLALKRDAVIVVECNADYCEEVKCPIDFIERRTTRRQPTKRVQRVRSKLHGAENSVSVTRLSQLEFWICFVGV